MIKQTPMNCPLQKGSITSNYVEAAPRSSRPYPSALEGLHLVFFLKTGIFDAYSCEPQGFHLYIINIFQEVWFGTFC